ncbi:MAG: archaetidylinositol phosphate synthase [Candidatus Bathycorpusculaceae bacterium]
MLTKLKKNIQELLRSEAELAYKLKITPNMLSATGIVLAFFSALSYAMYQDRSLYLLLGTALLSASGFCDALDGVLARLHGQETSFGGFLDSLFDRYGDAVIYVGLIIGGLCDVLWGLTALTGSLLVSYSRARAEAAGIEMESIGVAERAERMIILAAASIITIFLSQALNIGVILIAILSNFTVLQRAFYVYKKLKKKKS